MQVSIGFVPILKAFHGHLLNEIQALLIEAKMHRHHWDGKMQGKLWEGHP